MQSLSKLNHFCEATNAVYGVSYGAHVLCVRIEIERERKQWSGRKKNEKRKKQTYIRSNISIFVIELDAFTAMCCYWKPIASYR